MKYRTQIALYTAGLLLVGGLTLREVLAQDDAAAPVPQTVQTAQAPQAQKGFGVSDFTIKPEAGAINFKGNTRMSSGLELDITMFKSDPVNILLSASGLYSGLNSNISGTNNFSSGIYGQNKTYIVQVPTEAYFRLFPTRSEKWDFGPHVGVNTIYSSSGVGNNWGSNDTFVTPGSGQGVRWNPHFTLGPSVTYHFNNTFQAGLNLSNTFMQAFNMRTLLLGIGITV